MSVVTSLDGNLQYHFEMSARRIFLHTSIALTVSFAPCFAHAQVMDAAPRVQLAAGGGLLTSGAYFGGPGGLEFGNGQAFTGQLELIAKVRPAFSLVLGAAHARPDWQLKGVPLVGSVQLPGARLWFVDAAVRGELSLGPGAGAVTVFAQAGPALVRYSFNTLPLGIAIERHATNVALGAGVGSALPLTGRLGIEVMAKDYIASFKSIRDFEAFGVEGRRAHTVLLTLSARVGL